MSERKKDWPLTLGAILSIGFVIAFGIVFAAAIRSQAAFVDACHARGGEPYRGKCFAAGSER